MKLVTFLTAATSHAARVGVAVPSPDGDGDGNVIDLQSAHIAQHGSPNPALADMLALLDAGPAALDLARSLCEFATTQRPPGVLLSLGNVQLLSPLTRPRSLRDCLSFERHLVQCSRTVIGWKAPWLARLDGWWERTRGRPLVRLPAVWYERPLYYKGNPHSVVGQEADIHWPSFTEKLDYELELGIVIGTGGRNIAEANARRHIAGYIIFNDFSARDVQLREMQGRLGPAKGKDFDTGNALGPWLVTPDEVPDPYNLRMAARVNGETWSEGNSGQMHYTFEQMIAYISQDETLHPGEFIGAGTVPNGCGLELDRWLKPGDVVELEVEKLGLLRNRIVRLEAGDRRLEG